MINFRHENDGSEALPPGVPGHVSHAVVPWKRRQCCATRALAFLLPCWRAAGLARVLATCDEDNVAPRRVIEANGGVPDGTEPHPCRPGGTMLRFRAPTS